MKASKAVTLTIAVCLGGCSALRNDSDRAQNVIGVNCERIEVSHTIERTRGSVKVDSPPIIGGN